MSQFEPLTDEQREFERSLRQLKPAAVSFDESDLMFQTGRAAGQREARRSVRRWQASTLAASLCAVFGIGLNGFAPDASSDAHRSVAVDSSAADSNAKPVAAPPLEEPEQGVASVESESDPASPDRREVSPSETVRASTAIGRWWEDLLTVSETDQDSYLGLRNRVLEHGVDALPPSTGGSREMRSEPLTSSPRQTRELLDSVFPSQI